MGFRHQLSISFVSQFGLDHYEMLPADMLECDKWEHRRLFLSIPTRTCSFIAEVVGDTRDFQKKSLLAKTPYGPDFVLGREQSGPRR